MHGLSRALPLALVTCMACGGIAEGPETESQPPKSTSSATLYLNFDGAFLHYGSKNDAAAGLTALADGPGPYQIAAPVLDRFADAAAPSRSRVIQDVARQVRAVYQPFALEVVTERPESGQFTMLVVGNTFGEIQFAEQCPLAGLAVRDCAGAQDGDVGFAAAACVPEQLSPADARRQLARTIAHEAGHTFGLTHSEDVNSIMAAKSMGLAWGQGPVPLEDQASCQRATQNDYAVLSRVLGLRGAP